MVSRAIALAAAAELVMTPHRLPGRRTLTAAQAAAAAMALPAGSGSSSRTPAPPARPASLRCCAAVSRARSATRTAPAPRSLRATLPSRAARALPSTTTPHSWGRSSGAAGAAASAAAGRITRPASKALAAATNRRCAARTTHPEYTRARYLRAASDTLPDWLGHAQPGRELSSSRAASDARTALSYLRRPCLK